MLSPPTLQDKKVNHPEAANWGTPQMISDVSRKEMW